MKSDNPLTLSRRKKMNLLKEALLDIIDLTQLKYVERDRIHMAKFKRLRDSVKNMKQDVFGWQ